MIPGAHFHPPQTPPFYQPGCNLRIPAEVATITAQRIETGTPDGDAMGFSGDLFSGWLESEDGRLYLHYIISRHKNEGNTKRLILIWLARGYDIRIVMPRPIMRHIIKKFGFEPSYEFLPGHYEHPVEVWCRTTSWNDLCSASPEPLPAFPG